MAAATNEETAKFYDEYSSRQQKGAVNNERHLLLYDEMKRLGLSAQSNVLELGCGIGAITQLMAQTVTKGKIIGMDLSPKCIDIAKQNLAAHSNIDLSVGDITKVDQKGTAFDFITLFDVLEHVPIDLHKDFFQLLSAHMGDHTKLFINIPHPGLLEYLHEHEPDNLQIIDQPLPANHLIGLAYESGMVLSFFRTNSIWHENDYQMMLFEKKTPYQKVALPEKPRNWSTAIKGKLGW